MSPSVSFTSFAPVQRSTIYLEISMFTKEHQTIKASVRPTWVSGTTTSHFQDYRLCVEMCRGTQELIFGLFLLSFPIPFFIYLVHPLLPLPSSSFSLLLFPFPFRSLPLEGEPRKPAKGSGGSL